MGCWWEGDGTLEQGLFEKSLIKACLQSYGQGSEKSTWDSEIHQTEEPLEL